MFNAEKLLGKMVKQGLKSGLGGKKSMVSAVPGGWKSIAGVGALGVAIAAFDHFTQKKQAAAPPPSSPPPPSNHSGPFPKGPPPPPPPTPGAPHQAVDIPKESASLQESALLLIRAMIAAANADGKIDSQEKETILKHLQEAGADPEEEAFLLGELNSPPSIDSLLPKISSPEMAAEVYAVSLLAVDIDTKAERDYLNYLRSRLEMDESKVEEIHKQLKIPI